jgi:hypothetical protein
MKRNSKIKDTFNHEEPINHQLGRTEYTSTIWALKIPHPLKMNN